MVHATGNELVAALDADSGTRPERVHMRNMLRGPLRDGFVVSNAEPGQGADTPGARPNQRFQRRSPTVNSTFVASHATRVLLENIRSIRLTQTYP